MSTPKKLPSGQWRAQGYYKDPITGKIDRPSFTADSKSECARMVSEWMANRTTRNPSDMTVGECLDRYIASKTPTLSPSTARGYLWMRKNRFSEISRLPLSKVTDEVLQKYVSDLTLRVSPKTVRNTYGLLIASIEMFTDRIYHVTMPTKKARELSIPTDAEIKRLLDAASDKMKLVISLSAFGTLRRGEIPALKYKDVLRDKNAIYVHADFVLAPDGKYVYKESPKTDASARVVTLPREVMGMIGDGDPEEFIVKANPGTIEKTFCELRNKVGLKCRFHDLRHYSASIMHALGIPDQYIMEMGGWATDSVLKSVYRNTLSDQSEKFRSVASDHFSNIIRE